MALTKISSSEIQTGAVTADKIANNVTLGGPKITTVNVANSAYTVLDDTAVNIGGGYIVITGSGFESGAQVIIDTTTATSVAYVNNTTLRAEVPSKSAASYNLYVVNPDGGTAIRVNGLTYSANPTWVTASPLANWAVDVAANVAFSATGATSYSNTTALPAGTQLLSNGYFYGTVTGITVETQYTFTVRATDVENQESDKSFSVTVTVGPKYELWAWGSNGNGQLGLGDTISKSSPTQVGSDNTWNLVNINTGVFTSIKTNGTLWSAGYNGLGGPLGLGDLNDKSSPTQVGFDTTWNLASVGQYKTMAIKTNGTLWAWGSNGYGVLGLGDTVNRSSPVQVGSNTNWNKVNCVLTTTVATKTDGTLWTWGSNGGGALGLNDTVYKSSPTQVGSSTTWNKISAGQYMVLATKTDGTLWTWGSNNHGQLGLGLSYTVSKSSPTQIGSGTTWNLVTSSRYSTAATKTDGTLWLWGLNTYGQLGLGDTVYRSSPVQVGSGTTWNKISIGWQATMSTKTDGTLWAWGRNSAGQLGLGNTVYKSSPTQVGLGTTWNNISIGQYSVLATKQV